MMKHSRLIVITVTTAVQEIAKETNGRLIGRKTWSLLGKFTTFFTLSGVDYPE